MKITDISIIAVPAGPTPVHKIVQVPTVRRTQYTHTRSEVSTDGYTYILRVDTDGDIFSLVDIHPQSLTGHPKNMAALLRANVIGENPLAREFLFQKLFLGTRWVYQHPGWFGAFDLCLWDIAGKAVGPDYDLMLDPVCSYSLREAIEVGNLMNELDYLWLEEPMHEQKMTSYQELCDVLTIPVMGTERLMHDMDLTAQWLLNGATDMLRANARDGGATQVLKLAHFAELNNTTVEMNGPGALFGIVHATLGQVIQNTQFYELSCGGSHKRPDDRFKEQAESVGMLNAPRVVDGKMIPEDGPGWGAVWDMAYLEKHTEETF